MKSPKSSNKTKPLHLLIDGADGLGKTTICQLLSKKLGIPVIKMCDMPKYFGKSPEKASEIYNKTILQFRDFPFIMDRGWPTSIVYSNIYRRNLSNIEYIYEDIIDRLDEKVIILTGSKPFRGDKFVSQDKWKKLNEYYRDVFSQIDIVIDVDGKTPQQICNQILKNI